MNQTSPHTRESICECMDNLQGPKSMRTYVPAIDQFLRDRGIAHARCEYLGADGHGRFERLQFLGADGMPCRIADGTVNLQLETTFRALLLTRYPQWCGGEGSGGDFRWNLITNVLTHVHCIRGSVIDRATHHNV